MPRMHVMTKRTTITTVLRVAGAMKPPTFRVQ